MVSSPLPFILGCSVAGTFCAGVAGVKLGGLLEVFFPLYLYEQAVLE